MKREDLTGQVFGRLTVIAYVRTHKTPSGQSKAIWSCRCNCGNVVETGSQRLKSGNTASCGCLHREMNSRRLKTHGMTRSPTYQSWRAMRERCSNQNNSHYDSYGGRGIKVCEAWQASFQVFLADMGERPDGRTLDRIDVNGNYAPSNCKWSTDLEQRMNKRKAV